MNIYYKESSDKVNMLIYGHNIKGEVSPHASKPTAFPLPLSAEFHSATPQYGVVSLKRWRHYLWWEKGKGK